MKTKYQIKFVLFSAIACTAIYFFALLLFWVVALHHPHWYSDSVWGISDSVWDYALPSFVPGLFLGLASVAAFMAVKDLAKWVAILVFAVLPYISTVLSIIFIYWVFLMLSGAAIFTPASLLCYFVMVGLVRRYPPTSPSAEVESMGAGA